MQAPPVSVLTRTAHGVAHPATPPPRRSIGQDCQHLRNIHPLQLRLSLTPDDGSWRLEANTPDCNLS